jgi:hypothetical protein
VKWATAAIVAATMCGCCEAAAARWMTPLGNKALFEFYTGDQYKSYCLNFELEIRKKVRCCWHVAGMVVGAAAFARTAR